MTVKIKNHKKFRDTLIQRIKVIQDYMIPMRDKMEWGYLIPYAVTGILNRHPRAAIAMRKTEDRDKYLEFYTDILDH